MTETLFSTGFAWGDDEGVATAATPVATRAAARTKAQKVTETHLKPASVAGVAGVAETEGQRLERLLSQPMSPMSATRGATPKTADLCGIQTDSLGGVAPVASVADWIAGVDAMQAARVLPNLYHGQWRAVVRDALSFLRTWADDAIKAGWTTLDVFGVNPNPSHGRYDRLGLVVLLAGQPIQSLDSEIALIGGARQTPTTFRRRLRAGGAVPLWEVL